MLYCPKALPFGRASVVPEGIPVFVEVNGSERHNGLCPLRAPAHPGEFQSVVDEVPTRTFNDTASDGIPSGQIDFVPYVLSVAFKVPHDVVEGVSGGIGKFVLGEHLLESSDHPARLSPEEHSETFGHEFPGLRATLVIEAKSGFPQVFRDVKDIQSIRAQAQNPRVVRCYVQVADTFSCK